MHCYEWAPSLNVYSDMYVHIRHISSVQLLSRVRLFATPWIAARQASLSITNSQTHTYTLKQADTHSASALYVVV